VVSCFLFFLCVVLGSHFLHIVSPATAVLSISYVFMGLVILSIMVLSGLFMLLGGKILLTVWKSPSVESTVIFRVTLIAVSCVMSMLASISVMISYFALPGGSGIPSFGSNVGLLVMRDVFQLIYLIGTVVAFSLHSFHVSTNGKSSSSKDVEKVTGGINAEDIILDLSEKPAQKE